MAASPAIVQLVGGTSADSIAHSREMEPITIGRSNAFTIPALDSRGTPAGIDIRKVVDTGIQPIINTGIVHKEEGWASLAPESPARQWPAFRNPFYHCRKKETHKPPFPPLGRTSAFPPLTSLGRPAGFSLLCVLGNCGRECTRSIRDKRKRLVVS